MGRRFIHNPVRSAQGTGRRSSLLIRGVISAVIAIAYPYAELMWKCRSGFETSEGCVWGKSYLPLSRIMEPLIIAPILFVALTIVAWFWDQHKN